MDEGIDWATIIGVVALVVSILALFRDVFDFQLSWSNSQNIIKRFIASKWSLYVTAILLISFYILSLLEKVSMLEYTIDNLDATAVEAQEDIVLAGVTVEVLETRVPEAYQQGVSTNQAINSQTIQSLEVQLFAVRATSETFKTQVAASKPQFYVRGGIQGLNVRAGPDISQPIILSLAPGTQVEMVEGPVTTERINWWRIRSAGIEGWVPIDFLEAR